jgi:hypothetical protein
MVETPLAFDANCGRMTGKPEVDLEGLLSGLLPVGRRFGQNRLVRRGSLYEGGARCEYRAEKAFRTARPDTPSLSNPPVHPLEI